MRINDESKRWVNEGIISDAQREDILGLYRKEHSGNAVLVIFAIIGSLLLGLGVILIFASNWEDIPRGAKTVISFLPLFAAIGAVTFAMLKKPDSVAFLEGTTLGLCLAIMATIALIEQVFQVATTVPEFLSLCMILFLPALYLFRAKAPALLYIICMIWSGGSREMPLWFSYMSAVLIIPYLAFEIKKIEHKALLCYLTLLAGATLVFALFRIPYEHLEWIHKFVAAPMLLIALDVFIKRVKPNSLMPFIFVSGLTIVITHIIFSFADANDLIDLIWKWDKDLGLLVLFCAIATAVYLAARLGKGQKFTLNAIDALMLVALLGIPLFWIWSNLLLLALGVCYIVLGSKVFSLKLTNYGMLILGSVIIARFFDAEMELLTRGLVFILIGAGFIFTNVVLHKKWRAK